MNKLRAILSRKWVRVTLIIAVILVLLMGLNSILTKYFEQKAEEKAAASVQTEEAMNRDIEKVLSSSGTIEPLNTYEVTTLVNGEVVTADFEEGDQVKEGDVLYRISTETVDSKIDSANTSVERANRRYEKALADKAEAQKDYNNAVKDLGSRAVTATDGGIVTEILIREGDTIQAGSQLARLYDNSYMLLSVPFDASDARNAWVGERAEVELDESGEILSGTVTKVGTATSVLAGNRVVRMVTIRVKNPGGISTETLASASVGDANSSDTGTFKVLMDTILTAKSGGKVDTIRMQENRRVRKGDVILLFDGNSVENQLDSYQRTLDTAIDTVDSAREAIEDAKKSYEEQVDVLSDYSITAPISGQIISKNTLAGDKVNASNMTKSLCTIYDLSSVLFKMSIDELDIMSIKEGQDVEITADALEGVKIHGVVTNISLKSTTTGGVTQYPVTVKIEDVGDLLPGMNVTGKIVTSQKKGVVTVPVDALMRGDEVYVKDDSVKKASGDIPKGFRKVKVEIGLSDGDYIEIISGIKAGDVVYVPRKETTVTNPFVGPGGGPGGQSGEATPENTEYGSDMTTDSAQ